MNKNSVRNNSEDSKGKNNENDSKNITKKASTKEVLTSSHNNLENRKFILLRSLGEGAFGKVKEAIHVLTKEKLAVKILEKSRIKKQDDLVRIKREVHILSKVYHPNLIQLYEVIETKCYYFQIMEYARMGELSKYIRKMVRQTEPETFHIFKQLVSGVEYQHNQGYVHRDIKPSNILLDDNLTIKIIDFGLGNVFEKEQFLQTPCGSPCYAAPELIAGEIYDPIKVDIWSTGIVLYALAVGCLPFDEEDKAVLYKNIMTCNFMIPNYISVELKDLLKKILTRNPKKRLTIQQIKKHKWFATCAENDVISKEINSKGDKPECYYKDLALNSTEEKNLVRDRKMPKVKINKDVLLFTSKICKIKFAQLAKMINAWELNKYTTSYFLHQKKYKRGELDNEITLMNSKDETLPLKNTFINSTIMSSIGNNSRRASVSKDIFKDIEEDKKFILNAEKASRNLSKDNSLDVKAEDELKQANADTSQSRKVPVEISDQNSIKAKIFLPRKGKRATLDSIEPIIDKNFSLDRRFSLSPQSNSKVNPQSVKNSRNLQIQTSTNRANKDKCFVSTGVRKKDNPYTFMNQNPKILMKGYNNLKKIKQNDKSKKTCNNSVNTENSIKENSINNDTINIENEFQKSTITPKDERIPLKNNFSRPNSSLADVFRNNSTTKNNTTTSKTPTNIQIGNLIKNKNEVSNSVLYGKTFLQNEIMQTLEEKSIRKALRKIVQKERTPVGINNSFCYQNNGYQIGSYNIKNQKMMTEGNLNASEDMSKTINEPSSNTRRRTFSKIEPIIAKKKFLKKQQQSDDLNIHMNMNINFNQHNIKSKGRTPIQTNQSPNNQIFKTFDYGKSSNKDYSLMEKNNILISQSFDTRNNKTQRRCNKTDIFDTEKGYNTSCDNKVFSTNTSRNGSKSINKQPKISNRLNSINISQNKKLKIENCSQKIK